MTLACQVSMKPGSPSRVDPINPRNLTWRQSTRPTAELGSRKLGSRNPRLLSRCQFELTGFLMIFQWKWHVPLEHFMMEKYILPKNCAVSFSKNSSWDGNLSFDIDRDILDSGWYRPRTWTLIFHYPCESWTLTSGHSGWCGLGFIWRWNNTSSEISTVFMGWKICFLRSHIKSFSCFPTIKCLSKMSLKKNSQVAAVKTEFWSVAHLDSYVSIGQSRP